LVRPLALTCCARIRNHTRNLVRRAVRIVDVDLPPVIGGNRGQSAQTVIVVIYPVAVDISDLRDSEGVVEVPVLAVIRTVSIDVVVLDNPSIVIGDKLSPLHHVEGIAIPVGRSSGKTLGTVTVNIGYAREIPSVSRHFLSRSRPAGGDRLIEQMR